VSSGDIDNIEYSEEKWNVFNREHPGAGAFVQSPCIINQSYDIPYLGGVSLNGLTVYLDRDFARWWYGADTAPFISVHERFEWWIIHSLGLTYTASHRWANTAEDHAVLAAGLDPKAYNHFVERGVPMLEKKIPKVCPFDLDLYPYYDDPERMAQIRAAMR
jgi:hypothetical protein